MTHTGWNDYSHVRIPVIYWPPSEPIGDGTARTLWEIATLTDLGLALGKKIDMERISQDMTFDVEATGPRTLRMFCTCDERMENPYRLGAATLGWRFIDENFARLWMIGDQPRAYYSGFMRQRRQMLEELIPSQRRVWLWLAMIRCEPLFAAVAKVPSRYEELLGMIGYETFERELIGAFPALPKSFNKPPGTPPTRLDVAELVSILNVAFGAAKASATSGSVDLTAAATERLFEALFLIDATHGVPTSSGLAAAEDVAWFDDCALLAGEGTTKLSDALMSSRSAAARVAASGLEEYLS